MIKLVQYFFKEKHQEYPFLALELWGLSLFCLSSQLNIFFVLDLWLDTTRDLKTMTLGERFLIFDML